MKYSRKSNIIITVVLSLLAVLFMIPMLLVLINSFKGRLYISTQPFAFPTEETFVGFENYINGLATSGFFLAFLRSIFITVASVGLIVLCTSMTAWYIVTSAAINPENMWRYTERLPWVRMANGYLPP